jgi:hypothetical protein
MADGILFRTEAGVGRETPALTDDEVPSRGNHWEPHDLKRRRRLLAELDKEREARKQVGAEELLRARQEEEAKKLVEMERLEREEERERLLAEVEAEAGGARARRADDDHATAVAASSTASPALSSSGVDTEVRCDLG